MPASKTDPQLLADFLTGGTCMSYALREDGCLSVVAENGKKFLFSADQVAWAEKQLTRSRRPVGSRSPQGETEKAETETSPQTATKTPPKPAKKPRSAKK